MTRPDLERMWETFVRVGPSAGCLGPHIDILRSRVAPLIAHLTETRLINWYCVLFHNRESGVPTDAGDNDVFWHIRFSVAPDASDESISEALLSYCEMTRHIASADLRKIAGLATAKLRNGEIGDAWRIIGEQSEWLLRVLGTYRADLSWDDLMPELAQYLHFYRNMAQIAIV